MELALLIDFGSTYTKVTAVDLETETVTGTGRAFSTVETDIMEGFLRALGEMERSAGLSDPPYKYKLACSSAAGGLRMVAVGLVPDLTAEAAKRAALGAGARVTGVFTHELTGTETGKIRLQKPDIILLAGGTDGGNREVIVHNAGMLAGAGCIEAPVVIAGNKSVSEEVFSILAGAGIDARVTENVMPELNVLNIDPARETIRQVFLEKIVAAKGLKRAEQYIDRVLMPTPAAVLQASELLSRGLGDEPGLGDLMVVDPGGATTDVHSLAQGEPSGAGVTLKGLPEPFAKRTVEGDLGMRYSARALMEAVGIQRLCLVSGLSEKEVAGYIEQVSANPGMLYEGETAGKVEQALGYTAVDIAVGRHVGRLEVVYTPLGAGYFQTGKDLTRIKYLIGTGGIIVFHSDPGKMMRGALFDKDSPTVLKPVKPGLLVDRQYILAGMGLLSEVDPKASLRIMKKCLVEA